MISSTQLLERLIDSHRPEPTHIQPRFSRKTKRITVTINIRDVLVDASVPIKILNKAIDCVCNFSEGTGSAQMLLDELLHARQKYGHILVKTKRARGFQTNREGLSYDLQYSAACIYAFIRNQWQRSQEDRHSLLQVAESKLLARLQEENLVHEWNSHNRSWRNRLLTAILVVNAYGSERSQKGFLIHY